ncbi:putative transcription factor ARF family [Helianthus annuus]|nr:putative transcription factor ARF family [Helianthus annuus]KAJ0951708.1 putative transcription factor ARF family [Helianthus annuus]
MALPPRRPKRNLSTSECEKACGLRVFIRSAVCNYLRAQLWHECAGLTVKIPCPGDRVFYFPQGHLKQVEEITTQDGLDHIPIHGLPSKILCKVVDARLKAHSKTDEVYAKITLLPYFEHEGPNFFRTVPLNIPSRSFRKILTPTDVSKVGACGLPARDVERTFRPLDMSQDPASQDIVAKDLHGSTWHFKHTCRRRQKRHTLVKGWGNFVRQKKLHAGDACIFLRWQTETYVGICRAVRLHRPPRATMQHRVLSDAYLSINAGTPFTVYYYPWTSASPFVVAYDEVVESLQVNYSRGMCFEVQFDDEKPHHVLKTFTGIIISKEDVDPVKWPQSEWQCLRVTWDPRACGDGLPERVCPWHIRCLGLAAPHQQSLVSVYQEGFMPNIRHLPFSTTNGQGNGNRTLTLPDINAPSSSSQEQPRDKKDGRRVKLFGVYIG